MSVPPIASCLGLLRAEFSERHPSGAPSRDRLCCPLVFLYCATSFDCADFGRFQADKPWSPRPTCFHHAVLTRSASVPSIVQLVVIALSWIIAECRAQAWEERGNFGCASGREACESGRETCGRWFSAVSLFACSSFCPWPHWCGVPFIDEAV